MLTLPPSKSQISGEHSQYFLDQVLFLREIRQSDRAFRSHGRSVCGRLKHGSPLCYPSQLKDSRILRGYLLSRNSREIRLVFHQKPLTLDRQITVRHLDKKRIGRIPKLGKTRFDHLIKESLGTFLFASLRLRGLWSKRSYSPAFSCNLWM